MLTRETEMTVAAMGLVLCAAAAALEIEEEGKKTKKREKRSEKTSVSKKKKKVQDWLKRRVQLGHNRTLIYELEEEDIASFKNYLRIDPFNEILERITSRIKKLTTSYKKHSCTSQTGCYIEVPGNRKRFQVHQLLLQGVPQLLKFIFIGYFIAVFFRVPRMADSEGIGKIVRMVRGFSHLNRAHHSWLG